ncbi:hypothetical protein, partial [Streptomyces sp. NPDC046805]|uniref:hypothetical protein n=1 Tax=Streptomyces sp. NPDC046805 TaxID=3155134 RepID=UPI003408F917
MPVGGLVALALTDVWIALVVLAGMPLLAVRERPGGALVVVAHRISSARRADRVLVMDGTHTDCGTHEELLVRSPLYRDL